MTQPAAGEVAIRHRTVAANGLRFHVAECGEGDRLALLLHGFPECWYSWRHQMPLLARLGYRVWAPDLRGYGGTERPPKMTDYAIETLVEDVAGLVDASGASSTLLAAHDWGGIVAWAFASWRARPLDRLVMMNIPHPAAARRNGRTLSQLRRSWYIFFFQIPWLPEKILGAGRGLRLARTIPRTSVHPERFSPEDVEMFRASIAQPGALTAMLHYYRALVRGRGGRRMVERGFDVIETPTLLVWGEQDIALGLDLTRDTERWVRDLTLRTLPDSSHWVQQDTPEEVNAILEAWLSGRPVPGATADAVHAAS